MNLVFDIGGTHTRVGLTDGQRLRRVQHWATDPSAAGFEALVNQIRHYLAGEVIEQAVGGLPGVLNRETERLVRSPNLTGWIHLPVRRRLETMLGVPVTLLNDAALVGLGEATKGAGRGSKIVAYITVSTGVNGARIIDGKIDQAAVGFEIGYQLIAGEEGLVSLADLISGTSLGRRYGVEPAAINDPKVWREVAFNLAIGVYNTVVHWSPDVVVLGGAMMKDINIADVKAALEALPPVYDQWPPLKLASLADEGGLLGAQSFIAANLL